MRSLRTAFGAGGGFRRLRDSVALLMARSWVRQARRFLDHGEPRQTLACCRRALAHFPDSRGAYVLMARVLMPGDDYLTVLRCLHEQLRPRMYLEIGVRHGDSLALAAPGTMAVGIDPAPVIRAQIRSRARLYPLTSNEFFDKYDLLAEFGPFDLDLAFVDGLHQFEQVLRDFINIERHSCPRTVVVIHDCLPVARRVATPARATAFWCGDVWKIVPCLLEHRPDLRVRVVPSPPSGLGIVTGLDCGSTLLQDRYEQLVAEYRGQDLGYEYLDVVAMADVRNVVPNDGSRLCRELVSEGRQSTNGYEKRSLALRPSIAVDPRSPVY